MFSLFRRSVPKTLANRKGLTLVEILIVLAILGSVMALLLPRMVGGQDKARVKEARIQIGQLSQALTMYQSDCGKYPESLTGLSSPDSGCSNWGPEPYYKLKKGESTIKDPWGNDYQYTREGGEYILKSFGKDGADGGDAFNADITNEDL